MFCTTEMNLCKKKKEIKKGGFVNSGESWERLTCTSHGPVPAFIDQHIVVQVNPDSPTVRLVVKGDLLIKKRKQTLFLFTIAFKRSESLRI